MKKEKQMRVFKISPNYLRERTKWLNHPEIYQNMNMQYPMTLLETEKWFEKVIINKSRIDFVFEDKDKVVSMTGLTNIDTLNGLVEFYIMVNPECQGKGFGKKTTEFTLNYAFTKFNIHKVFLYTNHFNERANHLYESLGFELEGILREHKFKDGELIDRCIYGLLKGDWGKQAYSHYKIELEF